MNESPAEKRPSLNESNRKTQIAQLIISIFWVYLVTCGLNLFNQHVLMSLSLPWRMAAMIVTPWLLLLVPGLLMLRHQERVKDLGFSSENVPRQIAIGLLLALTLSLVLTVLPIMLGYKDMVTSRRYHHAWQFTFEFIHDLVSIGLTEELLFRGYFYQRIERLTRSKLAATLLSSLIFGVYHIFGGDLLQVLMTTLLGIVFCLFREKIRDCTLLSLILCHGIYDALIPVWAFIM